MASKLVLALILTALGGWCQSDERLVTVSFLVKTEAGNALSGWQVKSFKTGSRELASQFVGLTGTKIPAGFYQYVLTGPPVSRGIPGPDWIPTLSGRVEALRAEKFVVCTATNDVLSGMAIDWALPASFVITGKIEPAPPPDDEGEPLRIHIRHLNPWSDLDVKIDEDGRFRIYDYPSGACVLSVIRGPKVIHVQAVYFAQRSHSTSFVLRIGDTATPMLRVE